MQSSKNRKEVKHLHGEAYQRQRRKGKSPLCIGCSLHMNSPGKGLLCTEIIQKKPSQLSFWEKGKIMLR